MHLLLADEIPAMLQTSALARRLQSENAQLRAANAALHAEVDGLRRPRGSRVGGALRGMFGTKSD